jgi:hypothetical protein
MSVYQFVFADSFNRNIRDWNVSAVIKMEAMVRNKCLHLDANAMRMETDRTKEKTHMDMGMIPRTVCFRQFVQSRHRPLEGWRRDNHGCDGKGCLRYDSPDKHNSHSHERMTICFCSLTVPGHSMETLAIGTWVR